MTRSGDASNSERTGLTMTKSITKYAIILPLAITAVLMAFYVLNDPSDVQSSSVETLTTPPQLTTEVCHDTVSLTPDGLGPAGITMFRIFGHRDLVATTDPSPVGASNAPGSGVGHGVSAQPLPGHLSQEDPFPQ